MKVPEEFDKKSLGGAVHTMFEISWQKARDYIDSGKVTADGVRITDPRWRVTKGAELVLSMNAPRPIDDSFVIFIDSEVVVVNKPAGISTVPWRDEEDETMVDRVRSFLQKKYKDRELGVVHRLDKDTSGVVVFTRNLQAKRALEKQFHAHTVHRMYLAIVTGELEAQTIKTRLVRDRGDGRRGSSEEDNKGRDAVTHVAVREKLRNATLAECRLETGRTHQIRIHCNEVGHPIIGDPVYAPPHLRALAPRLMLHAAELGFTHPRSGEQMQWKKDPPVDFNLMLERLR